MHDPDVVAFEIRRPWPRLGRHRSNGPRWQLAYRHRPAPGSPAEAEAIATGRDRFPWWQRNSWAWRPVVAGRSVWFPALVTVWHREPGGKDSGEVCRHYVRWHDGVQWRTRVTNGWRWHAHHWRVQVPAVQQLRRRLLTRCEWCGGRSARGDAVNVSNQWDQESGSWWRGERGLFHMDCAAVERAHAVCLCEAPVLRHVGYGRCTNCGKYRRAGDWNAERTRLLAAVPRGERFRELFRPDADVPDADVPDAGVAAPARPASAPAPVVSDGEPAPPRQGLSALRYAVAVQAGHEWCFEHQRPRWDGFDPCASWHPDPVSRPELVWCLTCVRLHGPLDWGDDCDPEVTA